MNQGVRSYTCPMCHTASMISNEREPEVLIEAVEGGPTVRIVTVMGEEVHRCVVPDAPRSVRWQ